MLTSLTNRVNTFLLVLITLMAAAIIAILASRANAGPLDPPGPPASTGPTRIFSLPPAGLTISTPGSYIVEAELTGTPGSDGITITVPGVTLDLNGFALNGPAFLGPENGINVTTVGQVSVRNGIIREWGGYGLNAPITQGEYADLTFDHDGANGGHGVHIASSTLSDCEVTHSGGAGLSAVIADTNSTVMRCGFSSNPGNGLELNYATATNVSATNNGGTGIVATQVSTIVDSTSSLNSGDGMSAIRSTVMNSTAGGNGGDGIFVVGGASTVTENTASGNVVSGIHVTGTGSRIENNTASSNSGRGIWIDGGSSNNSVVSNTAFGNGIEGILVWPGGTANLIDSNHSSGNTSNNIAVDNVTAGQPPNVITRNWAMRVGAGNYAIGANNDAAPVTTAASAVNPMANIAQ